MSEPEIIQQSVTRNDYAETPRSGIINFMAPWAAPFSTDGLPPQPPVYWNQQRDWTLRSTVYNEDMWASAVGIAITKMSSLAWEVDSEIPLRAKRAQELLLATDWTAFLSMHLRDFLTTDNGAFIEIVRVGKAQASRIMGLVHLDSMRCTRTGDPDTPVIYRDRKGYEHEIQSWQVICLSDMPDPGETYFGVGLCAASRSYRAIYKLSVIERYVSEKVSGRRPLAIHFINSISPKQLSQAREAAESDAARQGVLSYMGAIVAPLMDADKPPDVSTAPLAEMPDRFDRKQETDLAILTYANAIGLDVQDVQPLTGQPLGTGAQSQVLDEKSKGKGLAAWRQDFMHNLNEMVLDERTTFAFIENDYRDQERKAAISKMRAEVSKTRIDGRITTAGQELQVLVDLDELPKEFLPQDTTPGDTLSDDEKPQSEEIGAGAETVDQQQPEAKQPPAEQVKTTTKATDKLDNLIDGEIGEAKKLYAEYGGETKSLKETILEIVHAKA